MIKSACLVEEENYLLAGIINLVLKVLSLAMTQPQQQSVWR
jgi:hypothetical protein